MSASQAEEASSILVARSLTTTLFVLKNSPTSFAPSRSALGPPGGQNLEELRLFGYFRGHFTTMESRTRQLGLPA
jgi:hypothetical protein